MFAPVSMPWLLALVTNWLCAKPLRIGFVVPI